MRNVLFFFGFLVTICCAQSCTKVSLIEKITEAQAEDIITTKLTAHPWKCETFMQDTYAVGEIMNQYFTFKKDKSLALKKDANITANGTWDGNVNAMTASVTFPASIGLIAEKLNGQWTMVRYSSYYIEMKQTINGVEKFIRLVNEP
jgi:hypothetical protein